MEKNKYIYFSILITYIIVISLIFLYVIFLNKYFVIPACPIYSNFGFYCPACGSTRAVLSLINLNFKKSFIYNPIIIYAFFTTTFYLIIEAIPSKKSIINWRLFVYVGLFILTLTFIIHNTIFLQLLP